MILLEAIVVGLIASVLTGGSLKRLSSVSLKGEAVLLVLLPIQLLWPMMSVRLRLDCQVSLLLWLFMMAALAAILMTNATKNWMLALAALGIAANVLVIGVNQAMPVDIRRASEIGAPRAAARDNLERDCLHEEMDEQTHLAFLADVIAIPGPPWQSGVVSGGDILLATGLSGWIFMAARKPRSE